MFTVEIHSVNGAIYESGPFPTEEAARKSVRRSSSVYVQWFVRDGDRRIAQARGVNGWTRWGDVPAGTEDERLAAIAAHGPHPFTYGIYPNDGNRCMVCGATRLNSVHDGRDDPEFRS